MQGPRLVCRKSNEVNVLGSVIVAGSAINMPCTDMNILLSLQRQVLLGIIAPDTQPEGPAGSIPALNLPSHESSPVSTAKMSRSDRRTASHLFRPPFAVPTPLPSPPPWRSPEDTPAVSYRSTEVESSHVQ